MVTAELAAAIPVLLILTGVVLSAVAVLSAHVRAQDAAREAARAAARGDAAAVQPLVRRAIDGGSVQTATTGGEVVATVRSQVRPLGGLFPAITVVEHSTAAREPDGGR